MNDFWVSETLKIATYGVVAYVSGLLVRWTNVKVNYTRKINFFTLFFVPLLLDRVFPYPPTLESRALSAVFSASFLASFIKPIRERVPLVATMFLSFDRPEDRPYTLFWLSTHKSDPISLDTGGTKPMMVTKEVGHARQTAEAHDSWQ